MQANLMEFGLKEDPEQTTKASQSVFLYLIPKIIDKGILKSIIQRFKIYYFCKTNSGDFGPRNN